MEVQKVKELIVTKLAELREGDVLTALDGKPYAKPLTVANELGLIPPAAPCAASGSSRPPAPASSGCSTPARWTGTA